MAKLDQLQRDIADLDPADFEQLIFELVKLEHKEAKKLAAPDGGADVIVPETSQGAPHVFQAKRHLTEPHWKDCTESLDQAVKKYEVKAITFCFPRDMTEPMLKKFKERLVERAPSVKIDYWGVSDIATRLDGAPSLAARFFERVRNDALRAAQRQLAQGNRPLDTGIDLLQQAIGLGEFAEELDPKFTQDIRIVGAGTPAPRWDELPMLVMRLGSEDGEREIEVSFWAREGVAIRGPSFGFTDDDAGRKAHDRARWELARGQKVVLTEGVALILHDAPQLFIQTQGQASAPHTGEVILNPGDPLDLIVSFAWGDGRPPTEKTFGVRPVPPRQMGRTEFAGADGVLLAELALSPVPDTTQIELSFSLGARFGSDARENREAAKMMAAFYRTVGLTLTCPGLLPERGLTEMPMPDKDQLDNSDAWERIFTELVLIEEHCNIRFDASQPMPRWVLNEISGAAQAIRQGGATITMNNVEMTVHPDNLRFVLDTLETGSSVRDPLEREILGRKVVLGVAHYQLPPMKITKLVPLGPRPDAMVRIQATPNEKDRQVSYNLLPAEPSGKIQVVRSLVEVPELFVPAQPS